MLSRRNFVAGTAAVGLGLTGTLPAIEPIVRTGRPRMRLSLAAYSMRQFLQAKAADPSALTLPQFIDWAAGYDLDAVELTAYYFPANTDAAYLAAIKRQCHVLGLDISGGAIGNNFTQPDGPELDKQMAYTKMWIERYAALGATAIRVFAGNPPKGTTEEEGLARAIKNLKSACEHAAKFGVILAIENHDYLTRIDRLVEVVKQIDSPYFGVNFDSGNVADPNPYEALKKIAPYAVNAQIKVEIPTGKGGLGSKEPADIPRIIGLLREAGYSGYVVLEYEGKEDPYVAVPRYLDELRKIIG